MTYAFQQIDGGFTYSRMLTLKGGFAAREAAKAFGLSWLAERGYDAFCVEDDDADDGVDLMTVKHRNLYQFAVNREASL